MATDEELLIYNVLVDNWNTGNSALPMFYYDDSIKLHDFRNYSAIKIYMISDIEQPKSLGYTAYQHEVYLAIDIRCNTRSKMMTDRDEVKRIIHANRKTLTGYDVFKKTNERKQASYINYFQYIIEISALKYRTTIV